MMRYLVALCIAMTFGGLFWMSSGARADYPVAATVSAGVSNPTPAPGSNVNITCTLRDAAGAPLAGQQCTFSIVSAPSGTSFGGAQSTVATSDSNGIATAVLGASATPGVIVVRVEAGGVTSQATINTGGTQQLPSTGGSPGGGFSLLLAAAIAALIATGATLLFMTLVRRRA